MRKVNYETPEIKVVRMDMDSALLLDLSGEHAGVETGSGGNASKENHFVSDDANGGGLWDDSDDE